MAATTNCPTGDMNAQLEAMHEKLKTAARIGKTLAERNLKLERAVGVLNAKLQATRVSPRKRSPYSPSDNLSIENRLRRERDIWIQRARQTESEMRSRQVEDARRFGDIVSKIRQKLEQAKSERVMLIQRISTPTKLAEAALRASSKSNAPPRLSPYASTSMTPQFPHTPSLTPNANKLLMAPSPSPIATTLEPSSRTSKRGGYRSTSAADLHRRFDENHANSFRTAPAGALDLSLEDRQRPPDDDPSSQRSKLTGPIRSAGGRPGRGVAETTPREEQDEKEQEAKRKRTYLGLQQTISIKNAEAAEWKAKYLNACEQLRRSENDGLAGAGAGEERPAMQRQQKKEKKGSRHSPSSSSDFSRNPECQSSVTRAALEKERVRLTQEFDRAAAEKAEEHSREVCVLREELARLRYESNARETNSTATIGEKDAKIEGLRAQLTKQGADYSQRIREVEGEKAQAVEDLRRREENETKLVADALDEERRRMAVVLKESERASEELKTRLGNYEKEEQGRRERAAQAMREREKEAEELRERVAHYQNQLANARERIAAVCAAYKKKMRAKRSRIGDVKSPVIKRGGKREDVEVSYERANMLPEGVSIEAPSPEESRSNAETSSILFPGREACESSSDDEEEKEEIYAGEDKGKGEGEEDPKSHTQSLTQVQIDNLSASAIVPDQEERDDDAKATENLPNSLEVSLGTSYNPAVAARLATAPLREEMSELEDELSRLKTRLDSEMHARQEAEAREEKLRETTIKSYSDLEEKKKKAASTIHSLEAALASSNQAREKAVSELEAKLAARLEQHSEDLRKNTESANALHSRKEAEIREIAEKEQHRLKKELARAAEEAVTKAREVQLMKEELSGLRQEFAAQKAESAVIDREKDGKIHDLETALAASEQAKEQVIVDFEGKLAARLEQHSEDLRKTAESANALRSQKVAAMRELSQKEKHRLKEELDRAVTASREKVIAICQEKDAKIDELNAQLNEQAADYSERIRALEAEKDQAKREQGTMKQQFESQTAEDKASHVRMKRLEGEANALIGAKEAEIQALKAQAQEREATVRKLESKLLEKGQLIVEKEKMLFKGKEKLRELSDCMNETVTQLKSQLAAQRVGTAALHTANDAKILELNDRLSRQADANRAKTRALVAEKQRWQRKTAGDMEVTLARQAENERELQKSAQAIESALRAEIREKDSKIHELVLKAQGRELEHRRILEAQIAGKDGEIRKMQSSVAKKEGQIKEVSARVGVVTKALESEIAELTARATRRDAGVKQQIQRARQATMATIESLLKDLHQSNSRRIAAKIQGENALRRAQYLDDALKHAVEENCLLKTENESLKPVARGESKEITAVHAAVGTSDDSSFSLSSSTRTQLEAQVRALTKRLEELSSGRAPLRHAARSKKVAFVNEEKEEGRGGSAMDKALRAKMLGTIECLLTDVRHLESRRVAANIRAENARRQVKIMEEQAKNRTEEVEVLENEVDVLHARCDTQEGQIRTVRQTAVARLRRISIDLESEVRHFMANHRAAQRPANAARRLPQDSINLCSEQLRDHPRRHLPTNKKNDSHTRNTPNQLSFTLTVPQETGHDVERDYSFASMKDSEKLCLADDSGLNEDLRRRNKASLDCSASSSEERVEEVINMATVFEKEDKKSIKYIRNTSTDKPHPNVARADDGLLISPLGARLAAKSEKVEENQTMPKFIFKNAAPGGGDNAAAAAAADDDDEADMDWERLREHIHDPVDENAGKEGLNPESPNDDADAEISTTGLEGGGGEIDDEINLAIDGEMEEIYDSLEHISKNLSVHLDDISEIFNGDSDDDLSSPEHKGGESSKARSLGEAAPAPHPANAREVAEATATIQAFALSVLAPRALRKRAQKRARKRNTIREIVTCERVYVHNLRTLRDVYQRPLKELARKRGWDQGDIEKIFSYLEPILALHEDTILKELDKAYSSKSDISLVFIKFGKWFGIYAQYLQNYNNACDLVKSYQQKSRTFSRFLQEQRRKKDAGRRRFLDLHSYLIMPCQRIPRYELLLKTLIGHYSEEEKSEAEYKNVIRAHKAIREVAMSNERLQRNAEDIGRVRKLQETLGNLPFPLFAPSRQLLMDVVGISLTESRGVSSENKESHSPHDLSSAPFKPTTGAVAWRRGKVVLFTDLLLWADEDGRCLGCTSLFGARVLTMRSNDVDNKEELSDKAALPTTSALLSASLCIFLPRTRGNDMDDGDNGKDQYGDGVTCTYDDIPVFLSVKFTSQKAADRFSQQLRLAIDTADVAQDSRRRRMFSSQGQSQR